MAWWYSVDDHIRVGCGCRCNALIAACCCWQDGRTALHLAILHGLVDNDMDIVRLLVNYGANVNVKDEVRATVHAPAQSNFRSTQWHRSPGWGPGGWQREQLSPPSKFLAVGKLFYNFHVRKFSSESLKLGAKTPILRKFSGKSKTLSTRNFRYLKFATLCGNSVFLPRLLFQPMTPLALRSLKTFGYV